MTFGGVPVFNSMRGKLDKVMKTSEDRSCLTFCGDRLLKNSEAPTSSDMPTYEAKC